MSVVIFVVVAAAVLDAAATTMIGMTLIAAPLLAVVTVSFAAAFVPDGVGQQVQCLDRCDRVVAGDHKVARTRASFRGLVSNDDAEARTGVQRRREGVVDQLPILVLAAESDAGHVQATIAHV